MLWFDYLICHTLLPMKNIKNLNFKHRLYDLKESSIDTLVNISGLRCYIHSYSYVFLGIPSFVVLLCFRFSLFNFEFSLDSVK